MLCNRLLFEAIHKSEKKTVTCRAYRDGTYMAGLQWFLYIDYDMVLTKASLVLMGINVMRE